MSEIGTTDGLSRRSSYNVLLLPTSISCFETTDDDISVVVFMSAVLNPVSCERLNIDWLDENCSTLHCLLSPAVAAAIDVWMLWLLFLAAAIACKMA